MLTRVVIVASVTKLVFPSGSSEKDISISQESTYETLSAALLMAPIMQALILTVQDSSGLDF